ncbi:hypothetical protein DM02DRAFT_604063 [Periconia macrospinosa]|uniref:BTB domain-containing protein n=1 Tax=Periconia macrospinosa TaxID=97972 RepID=A0A2V1D5T7_9PLEO|nr:hypothetical protein DM02DRAFT_604063 [Periconia macrospinosa]
MDQVEDVEVVLSHGRRYKFHSGTLARNSTLLASMLTEQNAARLSNKAKNAGVRIKWMVELKQLPDRDHQAGVLGLHGERADGRNGMILNENGRIPTKVFDHYEAILYAFYNKEIRISDADMRAALQDVTQMVCIAEYLGCVAVISKPVEVALLKHGQNLYRSIQAMPASWIGMATSIKSESIFKEALCHLVGNWARLKKTAISTLKDYPAVKPLIEKYRKALMAKGKKVETGLMSIYPGDMCQPSSDLPIRREDYSRDILVWIALTWFRHWVGQRIIHEHGHNGEDGGFELYRQIGTGGEAYLDKVVINQFHGHFPMTKKALNVCENHLLEIKECMRSYIEKTAILQVKCELDIHKYPVPYLTCTEFDREDLPWLEQEKPHKHVAGVKRGVRPGGSTIARQSLQAASLEPRTSLGSEDADGTDDESEEDHQEPDRRKRAKHT